MHFDITSFLMGLTAGILYMVFQIKWLVRKRVKK